MSETLLKLRIGGKIWIRIVARFIVTKPIWSREYSNAFELSMVHPELVYFGYIVLYAKVLHFFA